MPIEIRELIIKATITEDGKGKQVQASTSPGNDVSANEEIIYMSAEKILALIKDKNER